MNKNIIIAILIIIICFMGIYIYGVQKDLTLNDYFDTSGDYESHWDNSSNKISVYKEFPLKFNQTYENVSVLIDFHDSDGNIESKEVVNDTDNGKLIISTTEKLSAEPTDIAFDIHDGELIDSDSAGLEYSRNFHLF